MNLRLTDLNLLRPLDALLRHRHVGRAAESLSMSQPAMSRALAVLRQALNDPLLVRQNHKYVLTPQAQFLAAALPQELQRLEHLLQPPHFDPATAVKTFRIGLLDYEATVILPRLVEAISQEAPQVRLEIIGGDGTNLRHVADGTVDAAMQSPRQPPEGCRRSTLFRERLISLHPVELSPLSLQAYVGIGHVAVSTPDNERSSIDLALDELGQSRSVVVKLPYFAAAFRVATHARLIFTGPARLIHAHPLPDYMALSRPPLPGFNDTWSVSLYWPERLHNDPANQWLRKFLRRIVMRASG